MDDKKKKRPVIAICIVAAVLCIACAAYVAYVLYSWLAEKNAYADFKDDVVTLEDVQNASWTGDREGDAPEIPDGIVSGVDDRKIDFDKLKSYNSELEAWLYIPNTEIDYPVARHAEGDQTFYLYHNMYQETAYSGCIYMENTNNADFSDNNTILYGHLMRNESMFHQLHNFEDEDFFEENEYFYVYTPGHCLTYRIFAAYTTEGIKLTAAYDFSDEEVYARYLKNVLNMRSMDVNLREGVEVTSDDKIVTLSTCVRNQHDKRYLVQGVLVDDRETE